MEMILQRKSFLVLALPALAVLVIVSIYPFVACVNNSFRFYDLTRPSEGKPWVGLTNYGLLLGDVRFWHSIKVTLYFVAFGVGAQLLLGFAMASLLNSLERVSKVILPVFLVPMVIIPVVVGLNWRLMYDQTLGIINYLLKALGVPSQPWLGSGFHAMLSVILTDTWEWSPLVFLILYSGMKALPTEPYEAAKIDGATGFQILTNVTLPLLKPVILIAILIRTIDAFKWFDTIYIMTSGGPGMATETASMYSYLIAFNFFNIGKGSAFSVLMLALVNVFCVFYARIITREGGLG
jgi:multiple sugar transport system permease protein